MTKKVTFSPKPAAIVSPNGDDWVNGRAPAERQEPARAQDTAPAEKMKRFTFDVPETLHRRIKARCAEKGVDMADEMRRLLIQYFPTS